MKNKKVRNIIIAISIVIFLMVIGKISQRNKGTDSQNEDKAQKSNWELFSEKAFQRGLDSLLNQPKYENNAGYFVWGVRWDNSLINHTLLTKGLIADGTPIEVHNWLEQGGVGSANKGIEYRANLVSGYNLPPIRGEPLTYTILSDLDKEKISVKITYTDKIVAGIHNGREVYFNFGNLDVLDKEDIERFKEFVRQIKQLYLENK